MRSASLALRRSRPWRRYVTAARLAVLAFVLVFASSVDVSAVKMSLMADMHLDPEYGSAAAYGVCIDMSYPPTGYKGCDAPVGLITLVTSDAMNQFSSYTFFAGGWQRHGMSATNLTTSDVFSRLASFFALIASSSPSLMPNTPRIVTALGNSDVMPDNVFDVAAATHPTLDAQIGVMQKDLLLTDAEGTAMARCGFYSRQVATTLRVLVLHSLVWTYKLMPTLDDSVTDPCGQFAWMESEIDAARAAGQKVIVMGHIAPQPNVSDVLSRGSIGTVEADMLWKPAYQATYTAILSKNRDVVSLQLFGHTHRFALLADSAMGVPLITISAITPLLGNLASYFIGDFDERSWTLTALTQRYLSTTGPSVQWVAGLETSAALGIANLSNLAELRTGIVSMLTNETAWTNYMTLRTGGAISAPCTTTFCRVYTVCTMLYAAHDSVSACTDAYSATTTTTAAASSATSSSSVDCDKATLLFTAAQRESTKAFLEEFLDTIPALGSLWICDNFCAWMHVSCSADGVELRMPSAGLTGSLPFVPPTATAAQVMMTVIDVSGNLGITQTLPPSWGNIATLKSVSVQGTRVLGTLPASWSNLPGLAHLDVSNTSMTGTLPSAWGAMRELVMFHADNAAFSGTLPDTWSGCKSLQHCRIANNQLTGTLPASWSALSEMLYLSVGQNRLEGLLPESWSAMSSLHVLDLRQNKLSGSIPAAWGDWPTLQAVDVSDNSLCGCLPLAWTNGKTTATADAALLLANCTTANACAVLSSTSTSSSSSSVSSSSGSVSSSGETSPSSSDSALRSSSSMSTVPPTSTTTTTVTASPPVDPAAFVGSQPRFHLRPPRNRVGSPNGPFRDPVTGTVHLYMQHSSSYASGGSAAWYHVTSTDYAKWTQPQPPISLRADRWYDRWGVNSGTMMNNNYSEPVVVYTCAESQSIQRQCIATFSASDLVGRRTLSVLEKSPLNPILSEDSIPGLVGFGSFRDPTEWWEDPAAAGQWLLAFAARIHNSDGDNAHVVVFTTSDPAFQSAYTFSHSLYTRRYEPDTVFEFPDFFTLTGGGERYLKLSAAATHRDYIVYGSYESGGASSGKYVYVEDSARSPTFIDYGPFYASKTFYDPVLKRRMMWGWTNEELSEAQTRVQGWSGVQNLPRTATYDEAEKKLKTYPIPELKGLRARHLVSREALTLPNNAHTPIVDGANATRHHEILVTFVLSSTAPFDGSTYYADDTAPEFGVLIRGDSAFAHYTSISVKMPAATAAPIAHAAQDTSTAPIRVYAAPAAEPEHNCSAECAKDRRCISWTYTTAPSPVCALFWTTSGRVQSTAAQSGTVNVPQLYMNRTLSQSIGSTQPLLGRSPLKQTNPHVVQLRIFVDDSVVEVFKDNGLETMTGRLYLPGGESQTCIALYTKNLDDVTVSASFDVFTMDTLWASDAGPGVVRNYTNSLYDYLSFLADQQD